MLRRATQRGAGSLLVSLLGAMLVAGLASAGQLVVVVTTDGRAQAAADGAAHAAASLLASAPDRDQVVTAVVRNACTWRSAAADQPFAGECVEALRAAEDVVTHTPGARLVEFAVASDARSASAVAAGTGRVGLQTFAQVAVDRRLPVMGRLCMGGPENTGSWCYAVADAGAEETSPWGAPP